MIHPDIKYGVISAAELQIDQRELAARVGAGIDYSSSALTDSIERFKKNVNYRYAYCELPVIVSGAICDLGFAKVESRDLASLLKGCKNAFLIAVSVGIGIDRLITRLGATSRADAFFTDAIGSAAAESLCELICKRIEAGRSCTGRFSPGYGDFPLEFQRELLSRLNADSSVGITLNSSLLMTPMKSITAVIGIKE